MKYTNNIKHGLVFAGKRIIAMIYYSNGGKWEDLYVLQGTPRLKVVEKIIQDCPDFAKYYNINADTIPRLFSKLEGEHALKSYNYTIKE